MEDDVEVELELEKQLALAHELFPTWPKVCQAPTQSRKPIVYFQSGLPPNWWQLSEGQTDTKFKLDNYFTEGDKFSGEQNENEVGYSEHSSNGQYYNKIGITPTHI